MSIKTLIFALFAAFTTASGAAEESLRSLSAAEASTLGLGMDSADDVLLRAGDPSHGEFDQTVEQVAGSSRFSSYSALEARGISSQTYLDQTAGGVWCSIGSDNAFADVVVNDLPNGATLQVMRIWGLDADSNDDLTVSLIRRCFSANAASSVTTTVLGELNPPESTGNFSSSLFLPATVINNNSCSYTLRTRFSSPGGVTPCAGSDLRLQKVRLQWFP